MGMIQPGKIGLVVSCPCSAWLSGPLLTWMVKGWVRGLPVNGRSALLT